MPSRRLHNKSKKSEKPTLNSEDLASIESIFKHVKDGGAVDHLMTYSSDKYKYRQCLSKLIRHWAPGNIVKDLRVIGESFDIKLSSAKSENKPKDDD